jgi:hypothetical protein
MEDLKRIGTGISSIMTINGHLLLLVVATGLFVRLWSTNDRPRPPVVWRTPSRATSTMPPPQPAAADCDVSVHTVARTSESDILHEEVWNDSTCPIPLPAGIDTGEYRVVDDTGRVAKLVLAAPIPTTCTDTVPRSADWQTTTIESRRWYFIRLHTPVARTTLDCEMEFEQVSQSDSAAVEPIRTACTNRKFDFSGFDDAANSDAARPAEDFHPESPALPVTE